MGTVAEGGGVRLEGVYRGGINYRGKIIIEL